MIRMLTMLLLIGSVVLLNAASQSAASSSRAAVALPPDSLYHIEVPLETHEGKRTSWTAMQGRVRVVSMFYSSCPYACPLIIDTLRSVERRLEAAERERLGIVLVSFDPERDTPARLQSLVKERRLDVPRWTLARAADHDVRALAAALGIQYRRLDSGEFNHASTLVLLGEDGRVLASSSKLGAADPELVTRIRKALQGSLSPRT